MIGLVLGSQEVKIDKGELLSYKVGNHEYIHQKGSPGWGSSDTEMFPIIGPTKEANFRVITPKGLAVQDQHGLLRELEYTLVSTTKTQAIFKKNYTSGTAVKNAKYPAKSTEAFLSWPYHFQFQKSYEISENGLKIQFKITADSNMPFMLGYHPAFKIYTDNVKLKTVDQTFTLQQVLAAGSKALPILNCDNISLLEKRPLHIQTEGFGNFMVWTEVSNMLCIEPITFYPYSVSQDQLQNGFQYLNKKEKLFSVCITPAILTS